MAANRVLAENTATAEGRILHEKADSGKADRRGGLQTLRAVQLRSFALGTTGVADVVEKRGDVLTPVEYKRGNLGIIGKVLSSGAVEIKVLGRKVT